MADKAPRVWVVGEALIDLLASGEGSVAVVGGGAANTAKALANLEIPVCWIGGISTDKYGELIREELNAVDLSLANISKLPTALAKVDLDLNGSASYKFELEETATFDFDATWLPQERPDLLHIGTLATIIEPGASVLFEWARQLGTEIVFDPNIRPSVLQDKSKYRGAFKRWAEISKIVKMSDEDLEFLELEVEQILALGPSLVVLTEGAKGISGFTNSKRVTVPGVKVQVIDTVGAGDTVGAVIVEGALQYGVEGLLSNHLEEVLNRAAKVAAITCSRAGAKPPLLSELA